MTDLTVHVVKLRPDARLPTYAHPGDAGADLAICSPVRLRPGERALVGTGLAVHIPPGYVGLVHPRSGLAHRHGISIVNAPGTIDSGYRGEVMVNLINLDPAQTVVLEAGDRVAQLLITRVEQVRFDESERLADSERADGGHGSSGR